MRQLLFNPHGWIVAVFLMIFGLEAIVPPEYILSYAYIVPILLATYYTNGNWRWWVKVIAIICTLIPSFASSPNYIPEIHSDLFINQAFVAICLLVTAGIAERERQRQDANTDNYQATVNDQSRTIELREDFVSTVVHDLKTPLLGATETIKAFERGDFGSVTAEQKRALAVMSRSHQNGIHQIQIMLEVYRDDAIGLNLQYEDCELATLAETTIATIRDLATNRQVELRFVNETQTSEISCDPCRISRVLVNLLMNGICQSPRNSEIIVKLLDRSSHYLVQTTDRGRGVSAADLPHIFDKFYQNKISRHTKGSGLGLYLSKQIIEAHGGRIWVEPESQVGATFSFLIPKAPDFLN